MKHCEDASVEELLASITHWEDSRPGIAVNCSTAGGAYVMDYRWGDDLTTGDTLREALIAYGRKRLAKRGVLPGDLKLDWSER